jgi:hypothetical protein
MGRVDEVAEIRFFEDRIDLSIFSGGLLAR